MKEIEEINKKLEANNYISNNQINTTLFLAFMLKKPILIEGPPGTGKQNLQKQLQKVLTGTSLEYNVMRE